MPEVDAEANLAIGSQSEDSEAPISEDIPSMQDIKLGDITAGSDAEVTGEVLDNSSAVVEGRDEEASVSESQGDEDSNVPDSDSGNISDSDLTALNQAVMNANSAVGRRVQELTGLDVDISEGVDYWLTLARMQLEGHRIFGAKKTMKRAVVELQNLATGVLDLRRSLALLQRLMMEKQVDIREVEVVLLRLRAATAAAEKGDINVAATQIEELISDLVGDDLTALNPFLFRSFWMGVETRWPAGGDYGVLLVKVVNDGDNTIPPMRLQPPMPDYWACEPNVMDVPSLPPGGFIHVKFHVTPATQHGPDSMPLSRKLSIISGYSVRQGVVRCMMRLQNRSMEPLRDVLIAPWLPPNFVSTTLPLVERLAPDEVAHLIIPLKIAYDIEEEEEEEVA